MKSKSIRINHPNNNQFLKHETKLNDKVNKENKYYQKSEDENQRIILRK